MSREVLKIEYRHVHDPEGGDVVRVHDFETRVLMWAMPDGSLLLRSWAGDSLWEAFE